ncbi:MAG: hypothetical protein GWP12_03875 [Nitrospirae bacterium]|nr:hypothetical protein [Nitrospirota bacterium]
MYGYEGLLPKKRSGRPPKLDKEQKEELKVILNQKEYWTTKEIQRLIKDKFSVEYKKPTFRTFRYNFILNLNL